MLRSIEKHSGNEIVIVDNQWNIDTIGYLREQDQENNLVCPGCNQPVRVKAGFKKIWHFAHKALKDCPLSNDSANILLARKILYKWLQTKYPSGVSIEKQIEDKDNQNQKSRPVDCYIETEVQRKFAYWILEKGIRSRIGISGKFFRNNIHVQWVFLASMIKNKRGSKKKLLLSPTERDFMHHSQYGTCYYEGGNTLNYLDISDDVLISYRGLRLCHSPQVYTYENCKITELADVLICPRTGEFVHPGEHDDLKVLEEELKIQEQKESNEAKKREERLRKRIKENTKIINREVKDNYNFVLPEYVTCCLCGKLTKEWVTLNPNQCRKCLNESFGIVGKK